MHPALIRARDTRRAGLTLVEVMVALVLLGIIAGGIMSVVMRQQRFYQSATEVIDTRAQIRQAASVVPVDIRGISSVDGDIVQMTDSSLEVRGNMGSAVLCSRVAAGADAIITVTPMNIADGRVFTAFLARPKVNDIALVFNDSLAGTADDTWNAYTITAIDSTTAGCPQFTDAVKDAGKYRYTYTLSGPTGSLTVLPNMIVDGAPVRFVRRVRYALYQSATDRKWWLGYRECRGNGASCDAVQPVSGPYRPYVPNDTVNSGLAFVYRDSTGAVTNIATNVARIDLFVNGETQAPVSLGGNKSASVYRDYQRVTIAIRNHQGGN